MHTYMVPSHEICFSEQIYCFEICSNQFAYNLICAAGEEKLKLGLIRFPEENEGSFNWEFLKDIHYNTRCTAICFSPETSLLVFPKVTVCVAGADFTLRIFRTDLENSTSQQTLTGHSNYINDVAWDYNGEFLASVGDDHACKIWSAESQFEIVITFCLSSSGMSVKWHPEEPFKIMVAEKKGLVHLYNVRSQQAIASVEAARNPLMSADWALNNRLSISALSLGYVYTWDLRRPCVPIVNQMHEDGGRIVRISPDSEKVIASVGRPKSTLKVFTTTAKAPLFEAPLNLFSGIAWHNRLPYIGAACNRKICFWKVHIK